MKPLIKSGIENSVIALVVAGLCFWQLLGVVQEVDPPPAQIALLGFGLLFAGTMHCVFMMQLVRRTGRSFLPWLFAVVVLMPIGSAVLLALLLGDTDNADS